ncbi:unnamed protein product [Closterium sp. NIES-54]
MYDAVVASYFSPATAALGRLLLPYLFPELSAFAIVEDLVTHLCTSDARYCAALLADFLDRNSPPMYITLYFIVTCLPDSLRAVRDHFLALDPTALTVDLLEQHLLAAETSVVAVGAARGTPRTPFFEGAESEGAGSGGAKPRGAEPGGAELAGVEPGGAEPKGVEPGGAESKGAESGGAEPRGTASSGGPAGASPRLSPRPEPLSPLELREWFAQLTRLWSGAANAGDSAAGDIGAGGVGATHLGDAGVTAGAGGIGGAAIAAGDPAEPGGAGVGGAGAGGTGAGGAGAGGARARSTGAGGARAGGARAGDTGAVDPGAGGAGAGGAKSGGTGAGGTLLEPASPLPAPSPYTEQTGGLTERREPTSRLVSPVRNARRIPRSRPPPIPGTQAMALRPSPVPLRVHLPPPPASSLPAVPHPTFDLTRVASPTSESASPPFVGGECAFRTDVLEDRQEDFECLAAAVPRFTSMLLAPVGDPVAPNIPTPLSYAEAITGSPPAFKARYLARGLSQRQGVDYFQTFSPTPKMTTLWVLLHVAAQRDYELHSLDFSTAFLQGSLHEEIWPHWVVSCWTTLAALGFTPSSADPSLFLRTDTSLPPFYVIVYVDDPVFATADTEALTLVKSELQKRHTCTDLGELRSYLGLQITRDRASAPSP